MNRVKIYNLKPVWGNHSYSCSYSWRKRFGQISSTPPTESINWKYPCLVLISSDIPYNWYNDMARYAVEILRFESKYGVSLKTSFWKVAVRLLTVLQLWHCEKTQNKMDTMGSTMVSTMGSSSVHPSQPPNCSSPMGWPSEAMGCTAPQGPRPPTASAIHGHNHLGLGASDGTANSEAAYGLGLKKTLTNYTSYCWTIPILVEL